MRILMLNHNVSFVGGGTFFRAFELGRFLVKREHHVTVLASSASTILQFKSRKVDGVHLVEGPGLLPTRWRFGYDYYEALRRVQWVSQFDFDIVHAFDNRPTVVYPALFAKRSGACLIMDWCDWFGRGGSVEERPNPLLRLILRPLENYYEENFRKKADATTVIGQTLEQRALRLGLPPETIRRLPNGTDPTRLQPLNKMDVRQKLDLPGEGPIIGYLGSIFQADADLMLEAFFQIQNIYPNMLLIFLGNPKAQLPSAKGIILKGFVPRTQLNEYLAACDILWLPLSDTIANRGRWPSKIVDYFAVGRPTVACAVGDVASLLERTQAGITSDPNPSNFAQQTQFLLQNTQLMKLMGFNARRIAETDLNWENLANLVEQHYLQTLEWKQ